MKKPVPTTSEEDRFVGQAAKDYYEAAVAVDSFQKKVLKILHEITDEFDSKLTSLGLPFAKARDRKNLAPNPWVSRKLFQTHLEANIGLVWTSDREPEGKRLCAYCNIWFKDRESRDTLASSIKAAIKEPFNWASDGDGSSHIELFFSLEQSGKIKQNLRKCTAEFVRVLGPSRNLIKTSAKP